MLSSLLRNVEFRRYADFVSPAFFKVVPVRKVVRRARDLRARGKNDTVWEQARALRTSELQRVDLPVRLVDEAPKPPGDAVERARRVVELYFHQIFSDQDSLIDLRRASWGWSDGWQWSPARWLVDWEPDYIRSLRQIYRGFYTADDPTFDAGLNALGLEPVRDTFRAHFGGSDVVRFSISKFVDDFHAIFVRCKQTGVQLHEDFLPLGLFLATMYEHLEELGVEVDVRRCFIRATSPELVSIAGDAAHA